MNARRLAALWAGGRREGDCLVWTGTLMHQGYGEVSWEGRKWRVHRLAYVLTYGPIPDHIDVHHECRNRACFEPKHLRAKTRRENVLLSSAPPAVNARKTHCPDGHAYTPENTGRRRESGARYCKACKRARSKIRYWNVIKPRTMRARAEACS